MNPCEPRRHELGAHVLGGLDHRDETALLDHLRHCPACREEHDELAGSVPLLVLAAEASPQVPARVRDSVVAAAAHRRARRRWALRTAAAVLVAALLGGLAGNQLGTVTQPAVAVPLETVEPFSASGWVTFRPVEGGVAVELELEGLEPLPQPGVYEAWMYEVDRRIVSIGQLPRTGEATTFSFFATGSLDDYRGFWVTAEPDGRDPAHEGPTVVRAPVPRTR